MRDGQERHEAYVLVDRRQARPPRAGWRRKPDLFAVKQDRTGVGGGVACEHLDEGALAGAVGAHERMDLSWTDREIARPQGDHGAIGLREVPRLQQDGGFIHRELWGSRR